MRERVNVKLTIYLRCESSEKFLSLFQGENLTILCQPKESSESRIFGYTWARSNRELVKMNVPFLYFEDLYEGGSVLRVNNIQVYALLMLLCVQTCQIIPVQVSILIRLISEIGNIPVQFWKHSNRCVKQKSNTVLRRRWHLECYRTRCCFFTRMSRGLFVQYCQ